MEVESPHGSISKFGHHQNDIPVGTVRIRVGSGAGPIGLCSAPNPHRPRPNKITICVTTILFIALALTAPTFSGHVKHPDKELSGTATIGMTTGITSSGNEEYQDKQIKGNAATTGGNYRTVYVYT